MKVQQNPILRIFCLCWSELVMLPNLFPDCLRFPCFLLFHLPRLYSWRRVHCRWRWPVIGENVRHRFRNNTSRDRYSYAGCRSDGRIFQSLQKAHLAVTSKGHGFFKGAGWSLEDLKDAEALSYQGKERLGESVERSGNSFEMRKLLSVIAVAIVGLCCRGKIRRRNEVAGDR